MCGIYGRVAIREDLDVGRAISQTRMLSHRGPDYCGSHVAANVFLGHARLSILDLSTAGNQPFCDDRGNVLVFNGEIYNWKQLKEQYLRDLAPKSASDTEVLLHLLGKMGSGCLPLLNGMFALAYFDASSRTLLLARDATGIKPLHFVSTPEYFEFSSEVKNLSYTPAPDRLKEYLVFGRLDDEMWPFANVESVPAGNYIRVDGDTGQREQVAYGEVEGFVSRSRYERLAASDRLEAELHETLESSVLLHQQSDAPIGFLCSGGLDSALITAVAARQRRDLALYHADFEGEGSEVGYARQVASHLGVGIKETRMTKDLFWELFPQVTHALDLPVHQPTSVSLALIADKARSDGLKVLLSGEGADEMFGGYSWHRSYKNSLSNYSSRWRPSQLLSKAVRKFVYRSEGPDSYLYFKYASQRIQRHAHVGFGFSAWSLDEPIDSLSLVGQNFHAWPRWQQALRSYEWMDDPKERDVQAFLLNNMRVMMQPLLHRLDRVLMMHSIEGRVPFLERNLLELAVNLALRHKIRGPQSKWLLKQVALRYLPRNVVHRPKMGFHVPWLDYIDKFPRILSDGFVSEWTRLTRADLQAWCQGDFGKLYKLIAIEVWGRIFVHRQPWQDVRVEF